MPHSVSLDQLRTFIAAADEGSFSAAGRRLGRAQSVVSQTLANLEGQLGVTLFDRSGRLPVLTDQGRALLADARAVASHVDLLKAQARSLAGGLEPELSVAVDIMFPDETFAAAVAGFQKEYPTTLLRFDVESSAVIDPVLSRRCAVGVVGSWSLAPPQLIRETLLTVQLATVVSSRHPLADYRRPIPLAVLDDYVYLSHVDPADVSQALISVSRYARVWRLSHLEAKLAFLRAGLGFGTLPLHFVEADLASGSLVRIVREGAPAAGHVMTMSAVYRTDNPPGPAGRWFIERLKQDEAQRSKEKTALVAASKMSGSKHGHAPDVRSFASRRKRSR
jgi:DNA-binding transcriptional LysR family regulator